MPGGFQVGPLGFKGRDGGGSPFAGFDGFVGLGGVGGHGRGIRGLLGPAIPALPVRGGFLGPVETPLVRGGFRGFWKVTVGFPVVGFVGLNLAAVTNVLVTAAKFMGLRA